MKGHDLSSAYYETDHMIQQQVHSAIREGGETVKVISADTDVFDILYEKFF